MPKSTKNKNKFFLLKSILKLIIFILFLGIFWAILNQENLKIFYFLSIILIYLVISDLSKQVRSLKEKNTFLSYQLGSMGTGAPVSLSSQEIATNGIRSFRFKVKIIPNWNNIIDYFIEELKDKDFFQKLEFIQKEFFPNSTIPTDSPLIKFYDKNYLEYIIYLDSISGLEKIWSSHYKSFVNEIIFHDQILGDVSFNDHLNYSGKYSKSPIRKNFALSPHQIVFGDDDTYLGSKSNKLNGIPLLEIIKLIKYLCWYHPEYEPSFVFRNFPFHIEEKLKNSNAVYKIKDFNEENYEDEYIDIKFDENDKNYSSFLLHQKLYGKEITVNVGPDTTDGHIFSNKFMTIELEVETFNPPQLISEALFK